MIKKFFKTYYSLPDKRDRIDVTFERGYRNITVQYNGKQVAQFVSAADLLSAREITTDDSRLIHLRFLKDSTDFEVFFDGIQIDNSETSPQKVMANLKWPIYISLSWYIIVLLFSFFYIPNLFSILSYDPSLLITNVAFFYLITSTLIVIAAMIVALIWLNKANTTLYLVALIILAGDLVFGSLYQMGALFFAGGFGFLTLFALILPLLFKSAAVGSFMRNWKKFKQFAHMRDLAKSKTNPDLVDI